MGARVLDGLKAQQITWAPLSPNEAETLIRICASKAESLATAYQAQCAYLFLAAGRNSSTGTTIATNEEVARRVPKIRGSGTIRAEHYRKNIKERMKRWGLVDYVPEKYGSGKATEYRFPILESLLADGASAPTLELTKCNEYQGTPESLIPGTLVSSECNKYQAPWYQAHTSNTNHKRQESKSMGMEEGHSYYQEEYPSTPTPTAPPQRRQPAGSKRQAYCNSCKRLVSIAPSFDASIGQYTAKCPKCKTLMFVDGE